MKPLSPRERMLAGALLTAVAAVLFFLLFLLPMRSEAGRLATEIGTRRRQLAEAEVMYRSLPQLEQSTKDIQAQITRLSRSTENPTPEMVREIERLVSDRDLELIYIHPLEAEFLDTSTKYAVTFEARGPLEKVVNLLYGLEQSPQALWVEGVDLGKDRQGEALRATITVAVYSSKSPGKPSHAKS